MKKLLYNTAILLLHFSLITTLSECYGQSQLTEEDETDEAIDGFREGYIVLKGSKDTLFGFTKIKINSDSRITRVEFREIPENKRETFVVDIYLFPEKDTIRYFGFAGKHYIWLNFMDVGSSIKESEQTDMYGWMEILERGKILLSIGVCDAIPRTVGEFLSSFKKDSILMGVTNQTTFPRGVWNNGVFSDGKIKTYNKSNQTIYNNAANPRFCFCLKNGKQPSILLTNPNSHGAKIDNFLASTLTEKNRYRFLNYIADNAELFAKWKYESIKYWDIQKIVQEYNLTAKNNTK